jgi:hypothetical protein
LNIEVSIDTTQATPVLFAMLHTDTGEVGEYEFGAVEGADGPVQDASGNVITPSFNVNVVNMSDQRVTALGTVVAASVTAAVDGFLVIHTEADGGPGPVAGFAPVRAGTNLNVEVSLDPSVLTPRLWPMLHVDTGEAGVYEFGTVEGADLPVSDANGDVVTFGIDAAPAITFAGELGADSLMVERALIDKPGWLAIHANNEGAPGPVIGNAPLRPGANQNMVVALDPAAAGDLVFPMLHYDTNSNGIYEFGSVEGADGPVFVAGNVAVGPLELAAAEAPAEDTGGAAAGSCTVTRTGGNANLRTGPSTAFAVPGVLADGESVVAVGQAQASDGVWWNLDNGFWVRSDIVSEEGDCESLPTVAAPEAPAVPAGGDVPAPAATEEASA